MKYSQAVLFYEQEAKQLGDKLMFITSDGYGEQVQGYRVISWVGLEPDVIEYVNTLMDTSGIKKWDEAYDRIFDNNLEITRSK